LHVASTQEAVRVDDTIKIREPGFVHSNRVSGLVLHYPHNLILINRLFNQSSNSPEFRS
jgi:hypothetical protein